MRFALLLALVLALPCAGQESMAGRLQARFLASQLPAGLGQVVVAEAAGKRSEPFALSRNHLSEPVHLPARALSLQAAGSEKSLATITIPGEGEKFIVLFVPGRKTLFQAIVLADSRTAFPPGTFYLHNHTATDVMIVLGSEKATLKPGSGEILRPKGAKQGESFYQTSIGYRAGDKIQTLSLSRWPISKINRTYVLFFQEAKTGRVDFHAVDEYVPPETTKAKT